VRIQWGQPMDCVGVPDSGIGKISIDRSGLEKLSFIVGRGEKMLPTKLHKGTIKSGLFVPDDPQAYKLRYCAFEGKRVEECVTRERRHGTAKQRNYYWSVIIPVGCDCTGYSPDEMHEAFKMEHLRVRHDGLPDTIRSTESLDTVEKEGYYENCRRTITKLGGYCPLPNEVA
jgi:hypothetical protein